VNSDEGDLLGGFIPADHQTFTDFHSQDDSLSGI